MNCSECKKKKPESVPYIVHESIMARMERQFRRLWVVIIVLIALLAGSNIAWICYESQFETVETVEIEAEQDGSGINLINGGDINYVTESCDYQNENEG